MDKAKAAVSTFLGHEVKHTTTVDETVNPAVQQEHVTPTRHEKITTAIDREVHQDHHHTTVQPVRDTEVLPEKHTHNFAEVQHREIHHGNKHDIKKKLQDEAAQFKNTREVGNTQHTRSDGAAAKGEHVHHHVHETIQPVVQKETIQPEVVHTTVPIHEVHHHEAQHHTVTALPAVSIEEFKKAGGVLDGREKDTNKFQGEPRDIDATLGKHGVGNK